MAWLIFRSGERLYRVDLGFVDELITAGKVDRVPCCPDCVLGLMTHDRTAIPVLDPSRLSGGMSTHLDVPATLLVFRGEQGMWALPVDRNGLRVVHEDHVEQPDASEAAEHPELLDPGKVWGIVRRAVEAWFQALTEPEEHAPAAPEPASVSHAQGEGSHG